MLKLILPIVASLSPTLAPAAFDPEFRCNSPDQNVELVIDGVPYALHSGTPVKVKFSHRLVDGFSRAWVRIQPDLAVSGYSQLVFGNPPTNKGNSMDRLVRRQSEIVWTHYGESEFFPPKEILLTCDKSARSN